MKKNVSFAIFRKKSRRPRRKPQKSLGISLKAPMKQQIKGEMRRGVKEVKTRREARKRRVGRKVVWVQQRGRPFRRSWTGRKRKRSD